MQIFKSMKCGKKDCRNAGFYFKVPLCRSGTMMYNCDMKISLGEIFSGNSLQNESTVVGRARMERGEQFLATLSPDQISILRNENAIAELHSIQSLNEKISHIKRLTGAKCCNKDICGCFGFDKV